MRRLSVQASEEAIEIAYSRLAEGVDVGRASRITVAEAP